MTENANKTEQRTAIKTRVFNVSSLRDIMLIPNYNESCEHYIY